MSISAYHKPGASWCYQHGQAAPCEDCDKPCKICGGTGFVKDSGCEKCGATGLSGRAGVMWNQRHVAQ